jgi:hypothetical protein
MKPNPLVLAAFVGALGFAFDAPAHADLFDWSYTGTGISGSGTITATFLNSTNGGTFQVTHMTGTANGTTIVDVLPPGGYSFNDNLLFPNASAELDFAGLAFTVAGGMAFNLYFDTSATGDFNCGRIGYCVLGPGTVGTGGFTDPTAAITFAAAAVPGPIAGAGLPGLILASGGLLGWWRRRRKIA